MKRNALLLIAVLAVFSMGARRSKAPETTTVTVRQMNVKLMASRKLIGKVVATLKRGTPLDVVTDARKAGWYEVKTAEGKSGWVVADAVTEGRITLAEVPGGDDTHVSAEEAALAGRGFNKNVEREYSAKNADLDYAELDRIEAVTVDPNAAQAFARAGKLGGEE